MEPITLKEVIKQYPWVVASVAIGMLGLWAGAITVVFAVIFQNLQVAFTGAIIMGISFLIKLPEIIFTRRRNREFIAEQREKRENERQKELDKIRRSMTPAEWELYKIQLENQRLLTELKNKPAGISTVGMNTGPRAVYGVTQDLGD